MRAADIALLGAQLGLCVALSGCAMFVSKEEYRDYRAVQLAPDEDARLLALSRYASAHRDGRWIDEVQRERGQQDSAVFETRKSTRKGLELYLAAFPDGAFAAQARSRLVAIDVIEARTQQDERERQALEEQRKARDEELRRTWVDRFASYWVRTLIGLSGLLGQSIEQVAAQNPEFSRAFGRSPRPRCTSDACVKVYESRYALPVPGGTRIERAMRLVLRLHMTEGRLVRAELLMPGFGFSRWRETEDQRAVIDADAQDRGGAVAWAFAKLSAAIDQALAAQDIARARLAPEPSYELAPIELQRVAVTGERTDTTAADPGAPTKPALTPEQAAPGAGAEVTPDKTLQEIVTAPAPEAADMELAPMAIDAQGRAAAPAPEMDLSPMTVPAAGEEMVFEPMAVPKKAGAGAGPSGQPEPAASPQSPSVAAESAPARAEAFRMGSLRLVLFSADSRDAGPGIDGVVVELAR